MMHAVKSMENHQEVMEAQIDRTKQRLNTGVDVDGKLFAPFKDPKVKHINSRPLQRAAMLYEPVRYDVVHGLAGAELHASISGTAAKIGRFQNSLRKFSGWSREDRAAMREDFGRALMKSFAGWRP